MRVFLICLLSFLFHHGFGQDRTWQYFITSNANIYLPSQSEKQVYPIIGYNKEADPKLLIGGFGVGVSAFCSLKETFCFKAQANVSKHTYWDEGFELRGVVNEPLGNFVFGSSDLALGITATAHYLFSDKISLGTGLGAQLFTTTLSRIPKFENGEIASDRVSVNRYYKSFLPVLPLEFCIKGSKMMYTVRYEHGLTNRYKKALAKYETDRFGLLYFEVGFRIR